MTTAFLPCRVISCSSALSNIRELDAQKLSAERPASVGIAWTTNVEFVSAGIERDATVGSLLDIDDVGYLYAGLLKLSGKWFVLLNR